MSKVFFTFFRLVPSSGISSNDNRSKTTQLWVICHFPITFRIDLSRFYVAFTIALKSIQMHLSCWNNLILRFPTPASSVSWSRPLQGIPRPMCENLVVEPLLFLPCSCQTSCFSYRLSLLIFSVWVIHIY